VLKVAFDDAKKSSADLDFTGLDLILKKHHSQKSAAY
jgi:hypothetical protein